MNLIEKSRLGSLVEISTQRGKKIININQIAYIKANNKYSFIYLSSSESISTTHLLKWFENILPESLFFRCHKSYMINYRYVDCFTNITIILTRNILIPMSRERIDSFHYNYISFLENHKNVNVKI